MARYRLLLVLVVLGGCAGSPATASLPSSSLLTQRATGPVRHSAAGTSWLSPAVSQQPIVYVSDGSGVVYVYSQIGKGQRPIGALTGFEAPTSLFVRANGDLYVVASGSGTIPVFHRGQTRPFKTLKDIAGFEPVGVAVDSKNTVYVGNLSPNENLSGSISVFANGSTVPTETVIVPDTYAVRDVAVDSKDDVFFTFLQSFASGSFGGVAELVSPKVGTSAKHLLSTSSPAGLQLDRKDDLLVGDDYSSPTSIWTVPPPYTGSATNVVSVPGDAFRFALNGSENAIWVANASYRRAEEYSFSGQLLDATSRWRLTYPQGVACDPPGGR